MFPTADYNTVLVDTNIVSYQFGNSQEFSRFAPYLVDKIAAISFVTYAEVIEGIIYARWGEPRKNRLAAHLRTFLLIPIDLGIVNKYAEVVAESKWRGRTVENNDAWIAATAIRYNIPLLTNDNDFRTIPNLQVLPIETDEMK